VGAFFVPSSTSRLNAAREWPIHLNEMASLEKSELRVGEFLQKTDVQPFFASFLSSSALTRKKRDQKKSKKTARIG